jgi:hypothetical protein
MQLPAHGLLQAPARVPAAIRSVPCPDRASLGVTTIRPQQETRNPLEGCPTRPSSHYLMLFTIYNAPQQEPCLRCMRDAVRRPMLAPTDGLLTRPVDLFPPCSRTMSLRPRPPEDAPHFLFRSLGCDCVLAALGTHCKTIGPTLSLMV